jgi:hypothetical protein
MGKESAGGKFSLVRPVAAFAVAVVDVAVEAEVLDAPLGLADAEGLLAASLGQAAGAEEQEHGQRGEF